jgi:protein involved in polysaccharide export with SLBB domain
MKGNCRNRWGAARGGKWLTALGATLVVVLLAPQAWSQQGGRLDDVLHPGYILNVVIPEPGTTGERTVTVDENGEISLGFYGRVQVGGLSLDDARDELRFALRRYLRGTAGVDLSIELRQNLIRVSGWVRDPGFVAVGLQADPWLAIQAAGGPTDSADLSRIAVIRRNGEESVLDLRAYLTRQERGGLPRLEVGDEVMVPAVAGFSPVTGSSVFLDGPQMATSVVILGSVAQPGVYTRAPGLSALAALGLANGPRDDADLANVRLITDTGSRRLNLDEQIVGVSSESGLLPNSGTAIIYVPSRRRNETNPFTGGVSVIGAVNAPQHVEMGNPTPLLQVIAHAGGPSSDAELDRVRHMRVRERYSIASEYDMERYFDEGGDLENVMAEPGDIITVERSGTGAGQAVLTGLSTFTIVGSAILLSLTLSDRFSPD